MSIRSNLHVRCAFRIAKFSRVLGAYDAIVLMRRANTPQKQKAVAKDDATSTVVLKDVMKKAAFVELCNNVSMTLQVSVSFLRLPILLSNLQQLIGKVRSFPIHCKSVCVTDSFLFLVFSPTTLFLLQSLIKATPQKSGTLHQQLI